MNMQSGLGLMLLAVVLASSACSPSTPSAAGSAASNPPPVQRIDEVTRLGDKEGVATLYISGLRATNVDLSGLTEYATVDELVI